MAQNPVYYILNACRVYAYLREGRICSKDEGGAWAAGILPKAFQGIVTRALEVNRGNRQEERWDEVELETFAVLINERVKALLSAQEG
jgi:streptomycin 3"-adenylyltransferase